MMILNISFMLLFLVGTFSGCAMLQDEEVQITPRYKTPSELYNKALAYYQSGQYKQAKELFHQFIGQYPESLTYKAAVYELAHCYQLLGETKEALALFNRMVATYGDQDFWGEQALQRIKQMGGESL